MQISTVAVKIVACETTMVKPMYSSKDDGKIYQQIPPFSKATSFKLKSWTDTVEGYINEAKQLTLCILRNRHAMKRSYTWAVHINVNVVQTPKQITDLWTKACRNLRRKGIVALWIREPNKANKVHYHLVVKNNIGKKELEQAIEEAMPSRATVRWRKRVEPIKNEWYYCHYITKAKVSGYINGLRIADLYMRKRRLFKANQELKKYGVIGDFWERSKKRLWQEIKDKEKRIGEGLENPNVKRLAKHVHDMFGGDVPLKDIERSFGYWSEEAYVQDWIDRLLAGEWSEERR